MRRLRAAKHNNQIDEEKDADSIRRIHFVAHGCRKGSLTHITTTALERKKMSDSIRPDHFAAHGLRRGSATHVTTASPPSLASLASLALGGR
jgi:hypothetical protein